MQKYEEFIIYLSKTIDTSFKNSQDIHHNQHYYYIDVNSLNKYLFAEI